MFGITLPTNLSKAFKLADKVSTRYVDQQLAKEDAKQQDHTQAVEHHQQSRKLHRAEAQAKHISSLADRLSNMTAVSDKDTALVAAFLKS